MEELRWHILVDKKSKGGLKNGVIVESQVLKMYGEKNKYSKNIFGDTMDMGYKKEKWNEAKSEDLHVIVGGRIFLIKYPERITEEKA